MLIQYLRDDNRQPYGVIIATDEDSIGWSLCHKNDRWDRDFGIKKATYRANAHIGGVTVRKVFERAFELNMPPRLVRVLDGLETMCIRARRYYQST